MQNWQDDYRWQYLPYKNRTASFNTLAKINEQQVCGQPYLLIVTDWNFLLACDVGTSCPFEVYFLYRNVPKP